MRFRIEEKIFERFEGLSIGLVHAWGMENRGISDEILALIREKEEEIRRTLSLEALPEQPKIDVWRRAYSSFGANPKKYKSSVESLYSMILSGRSLRPINKVVDIYNYISLKHMVPVGGDDKDKVRGDIVLRFATGNEKFVPLNSQAEEVAREGEVVYMDDEEVLCRRWNWRESEKTKMTEETRSVILVVEGLPPLRQEDIQEITRDLSTLLDKHCGGKQETFLLDRTKREIEF